MSPETPSLIDNFPPNTLLATLQELLSETTLWDIATGTFDIGSLLALGELWQPHKTEKNHLRVLSASFSDEASTPLADFALDF